MKRRKQRPPAREIEGFGDAAVLGILSGNGMEVVADAFEIPVQSWMPQELLQACQLVIALGIDGSQRMAANLIMAGALVSKTHPVKFMKMHAEGALGVDEMFKEQGTSWEECCTEIRRVLDQIYAEAERLLREKYGV